MHPKIVPFTELVITVFFVVNFSTSSMIGTCQPKIIQPALRRLNTKIPGCALWYNRALQKSVLRHQLLEHMIRVAESEDNKEAVLAKLNQLDWEEEQYMKKCRRIKSWCIPFSPEALLWIRQCQATALSSGGMPEKIGTRAIWSGLPKDAGLTAPSLCQ